MILKLKISFLIVIALVIVTPGILNAQITIQSSDINVEIYPTNPEPYTNTTITLSSYSTDLNLAMIEWKSGTKTVLSGYGKSKYSFKTLGPNSPTSFTVLITPADSLNPISKSILINPSDVQLLWEAVDGYTPPFYRGKSFISPEGEIKVVAIANTSGTSANKKNMSYSWKLENNNDQENSGFNKDFYIFENNNLHETEKVSVNISSTTGNYTGNGNVTVPIIKPKIIFYKKSPTEGIYYNMAIQNDFFVEDDELTIVAEPYFLAIKNNESLFNYSWKVNGESIDTPIKKNELTIKPSSRGGYATISVTMENLRTLFQRVVGNLRINL